MASGGIPGPPNGGPELFTWVAEQYNHRKGHKLRLKILRLGRYIEVPYHLHELLDLSVLQELSVHRLAPVQIFSSDIMPKLGKVLIRSFTTRHWQAIQDLAASTETPLSLQLGGAMIYGLEADFLQFLHDSRVAQIILPQGVWEEIQKLGEVHERLSRLARVTDLGIEMSAKNAADFVFTSRHLLKPLASLKNLWIMGRHKDYLAPALIRQVASASPTLRFIKIQNRVWRIHRHVNHEGGIGLESLDEWEDEAHGPEFFHIPGPYPWQGLEVHVDL
ncbi:hypothetical protein F4782DRAFT_534832 [Xylaria castorea]|nr:hypothetical protein F4782DRAFT_534832 [Xylaria castorea]